MEWKPVENGIDSQAFPEYAEAAMDDFIASAEERFNEVLETVEVKRTELARMDELEEELPTA